jgi:hypothetical protein
MPRKTTVQNKTITGDKSITIGDNSSLSKSAPVGQQPEKMSAGMPPSIVGSESSGSKLIPFLCYAKENSTGVREFRERLKAEAWIDPWFDEEDILPGQMWEERVTDAVHNSHAVIVFLSSIAVRLEGFFHKELKLALDAAAEKPDGTIFIIPIRLDDCDVPERLRPYQYVDYFGDEAHKNRVYSSLITALKVRAENLGIKM